MSAYPSYSQAPSTSGYYQQPAPSIQSGYQQYQGYYQQPAAPPTSVPYNDEQYFRHDYSRRLTALTFNSRPLIQELSILAQTYSQTMSRVVIESIEQQLRMVSVFLRSNPSNGPLLQRHLDVYQPPKIKSLIRGRGKGRWCLMLHVFVFGSRCLSLFACTLTCVARS